MEVHYRLATPDDMPACADLFNESLSDLRRRQNAPASVPTPQATMVRFYEHVLATGIFEVAEVGGRLAALACAIVRDDLWFLSGFWARPELQRQNIGMPLLRSVHQAGREAGATTFFVDASTDPTAMAAYMKMGMLPGCQILGFSGTPNLTTRAPAGLKTEVLETSLALDLDRSTRGTPRAVDHEFFAAEGRRGRQVTRDGEPIGYYYLHDGAIGPAAWRQPQHAELILAAACREASAESTTVSFDAPGINHAAVRFALESGLRLAPHGHLLQSAPFGRMEQYLPSGPGLF
jgi:GNAT superfamily N-acetyltransferase